MRNYLVGLALLFMLLLTGCAHKNSVVGTWVSTTTSPSGIILRQTWQFTADGKNTTSVLATNGPRSGMALSSTGTYTVNGSTMTQTIQTMSEPGRTVIVPRPHTSTYQYVLDGNTLKITGGGSKDYAGLNLTLTRQAS